METLGFLLFIGAIFGYGTGYVPGWLAIAIAVSGLVVGLLGDAASNSRPTYRTPAGVRQLTRREEFAMDVLRRRGVDARPENADEWLPHVEEVLARNAMGNYIGYQEFHRRHPGR